MENSTSNSRVVKKLDDGIKRAFAQNDIFIVDHDHPSPTGVIFNYVRSITDVTGFTYTLDNAMSGSGTIPTAFIAQSEFPGQFKDITVATGYLFCTRF